MLSPNFPNFNFFSNLKLDIRKGLRKDKGLEIIGVMEV